jgi:ketosteroid isomerase-like protein
MSAIAIVDRLYAAWCDNDVPAVLACCKEDVLYSVYLADRGERRDYRGKCEMSSYLLAVAAAWQLLELRISKMRCDAQDSIVRCRVGLGLRHRATGRVVDDFKSHVWRVSDGLVAYCGESGDTGRLRAFCRMVDSA